MKKTRGRMAWLGGIAAVVLLAVVAVVALPFLVDLNQFKPQIQQVVASNLNAAVDFNSAKLSLFPKLGVQLRGVTIDNTDPEFAGVRLFAVEDALFQVDFLPLLQKQFIGELVIDQPEVTFARKGLKNNVAALSKATPDARKAETPEPETPADPGAQDAILKTVKESVVIKSVVLRGANLQIVDLADSGKKDAVPVRIKELDLSVRNIGLERDITTELSTKAHVAESGAKVDGPINLTMITNVALSGAGLERATFKGRLNLDDLAINVRDAFLKPKGVALNLDFAGQMAGNSLDLETITFNLHRVALNSTVKIGDFKTLATNATATVRSDDLASLGDLLPQHRAMLVDGSLALDAKLAGALSNPENLAASVDLTTKLTGSDLGLELRVAQLKPAKVSLDARSSRLDVGAIVKPFLASGSPATSPTPTDQTKVAANPSETKSSTDAAAEAQDFALSPEQKELLQGVDLKVNVSLKEIIYGDVIVKDFITRFHQQSLKAELAELGLAAFGGTVKSKGAVDLAAAPIAFDQAFNLDRVSAQEVVAIIKPEHRDLLQGRLSMNLVASGSGTTVKTLSKTLNGKGGFSLTEGELNTGSVAEQMQKEFDGFIGGLSIAKTAQSAFDAAEAALNNPLVKALPAKQKVDLSAYRAKYGSLKSVSLTQGLNVDKGLGDVSGQIEIKDGRVYITADRALAGGTFDFNGSIGLDMSLAGKTVFTASPATKTKLTSQSQYAKLLFDERGDLALDMGLGGTAMKPTVALDLAPIEARFTRNAKALVEAEVTKEVKAKLANLVGGQKAVVIDKAKKKLEAEASKAAGGAGGKEVDKAKKKLKGLFGR